MVVFIQVKNLKFLNLHIVGDNLFQFSSKKVKFVTKSIPMRTVRKYKHNWPFDLISLWY